MSHSNPEHIVGLLNQCLLLSMAPHGVPPFGWRDLSTPQSLLTPLSQKTVVKPELLHVFVIVDRCCKLSSSMCRVACPCSCNVSTRSVHVPPVQPLVVSSSSFVIPLLCSPPTSPPCHPCPPHPSHPQQLVCCSDCECQCESHDSFNEVSRRPLVPRVPRNRRILALLLGKRRVWPSHTFLNWVFIDPRM